MSKVWLDIPITYPLHIKNIHMTYQEHTLVWYARGRSVIYLCYLCYTKDIPLSIIFGTNFIYQKGSQNIPLWKYLKHTLATYLKLCFGYVDHTSNIPINYQEHIKFDIPKTYQSHTKNIHMTYHWSTLYILKFGMPEVGHWYVCTTSEIPKIYH